MQYLDTHSIIKKIVIVIVEASDRLVRKFHHGNITERYKCFHFFTKGDVTDRAAQDLHCHDCARIRNMLSPVETFFAPKMRY